jgi:quercetin dioxygenase-like cupin family protein
MNKIALDRVFAGLDGARRSAVVAAVNDARLRLVRLSGGGDFDRHPHDEFALVLKGELTVRFADRDVVLGPGEGVLIPRGAEHAASGLDAEFVLFEPSPKI